MPRPYSSPAPPSCGIFSRRAGDIGGKALTAEQMAQAISQVSGRNILFGHIPRECAELLALFHPQVDFQLWFWERQDRLEPRELEAELGIELATFKELWNTNKELLKQAFKKMNFINIKSIDEEQALLESLLQDIVIFHPPYETYPGESGPSMLLRAIPVSIASDFKKPIGVSNCDKFKLCQTCHTRGMIRWGIRL
ncbi:uncharacterized protein N7500_002620 [Penicillium coprophilum]|uniref:uncharacterized protein n=1 Tax=Penicillium coprophilum TaxID=36646 RepID=UPI0023A1CB79|nr:uncharacterized protein N7500_002620 [Penicillium coprophilum]KAJ5169837.1 hypothetical protein N7500_002620 [Penicillium coprophilum]